jgi:glycosyltransferase involved in cell wall biosynthesis
MNRPQMLLSIIIPVYNEELTIGNIIDRAKAAAAQIGLKYEVIVVDDHSYDRSLDVARRRNIRVFTLKEHLGKGRCGRGSLKLKAA